MARFDQARTVVRRFQLVVGIGFFSFVAGSLLSLAIGMRLQTLILGLHPVALEIAVTALGRFWEYAVLPLALYGAARVIPLSPWKTAVGAVVTGELFLLALDFATGGLEAWLHLAGVLRLVSIAGGIALSALAIRRARSSAEVAEKAARDTAEKKKSEYDEFVREAERIAALRDRAAPESASAADQATRTGTDGADL